MPQIIEISSIEELDGLLEKNNKHIVIFKHSTSCPISAKAYSEFKEFVANAHSGTYVLVKVIEHRPVSNEIAERFQVKHESPQVLHVNDGNVMWHDSHRRITKEELLRRLSR